MVKLRRAPMNMVLINANFLDSCKLMYLKFRVRRHVVTYNLTAAHYTLFFYIRIKVISILKLRFLHK